MSPVGHSLVWCCPLPDQWVWVFMRVRLISAPSSLSCIRQWDSSWIMIWTVLQSPNSPRMKKVIGISFMLAFMGFIVKMWVKLLSWVTAFSWSRKKSWQFDFDQGQGKIREFYLRIVKSVHLTKKSLRSQMLLFLITVLYEHCHCSRIPMV